MTSSKKTDPNAMPPAGSTWPAALFANLPATVSARMATLVEIREQFESFYAASCDGEEQPPRLKPQS